MFDNTDLECLISLVGNHSVIWDNTRDKYKDKEKTSVAWSLRTYENNLKTLLDVFLILRIIY